MNRPLRKRHRVIWFFLALFLPILVLFSVLKTPSFPYSEDVFAAPIAVHGSILKEIENESFKINLRGNNNTVKQIEILLKTPLPYAAVLVYDNNGLVLGQMGARGVHRFDVHETITAISIKDPIKNLVISEIKL